MALEAFRNNVLRAHELLASRLNGNAAAPLHQQRVSALQTFLDQGVPTTRHEEWKYTNVLPFIGSEFVTSLDADTAVTASDCARAMGSLAEALDGGWRVVFVNGHISVQLSSIPEHVNGLRIEPLTDTLIAEHPELATVAGANVAASTNPFVAANLALANNGVVIRVGSNIQLERPIHVVCITDVRASHRLATPRVVLLAETGSSVDVVESHHTLGDLIALDVTVAEVAVAANAHVRYHKVLDDGGALRHIGDMRADVSRDATFTAHTACLGGGFVRNDVSVRLCEPSSQGFLFGTSVLRDHEYADNHTTVDHCVPHCHSEELYKGIYNDSSVGVFNGKIYVRPQAQKTTAYQSSHAILLSERAQMNSKPQLEIWADDVKCSHGATTGQLDEDAVFYLQSRGIDAAKARALMTYAFVAEVVERIDLIALRQHLEERIADKLGAEPFAL